MRAVRRSFKSFGAATQGNDADAADPPRSHMRKMVEDRRSKGVLLTRLTLPSEGRHTHSEIRGRLGKRTNDKAPLVTMVCGRAFDAYLPYRT
jgi:hypothetical protein